MKKQIPTLLLLLACTLFAHAQKPDSLKLWKVEGFGSATLNQVSFTNWAAGGDNSVSFAFKALMSAKYNKGKHHWDNSLNSEFGLQWTKADGTQKNEDKIELETKYGFDLNKKKTLLLSALGNFKSQFAKGYNYPNDSLVISKFAAPGYLLLGVGIDWKPVDYFSLFVSPVTAKITFLRDDAIASAHLPGDLTGAYGNDIDPVTGEGDHTVVQLGAYMNAKFNKEIIKNITFLSKLELFENYTGDNSNAKMVDVNWQNGFLFKINDWLSASLSLEMIYDKEVKIPKDENDNGTFEANEFSDRVQFKEVLGVGLTYKFKNFKEVKK